MKAKILIVMLAAALFTAILVPAAIAADRESFSVTELTIVDKIILADGTEIAVSGDLISLSSTTLTISSTNPFTIKLNAIDALVFDNIAITGHVAVADITGNNVYIETEDGGIDTAVDGGSVGGLFNIKTGDGSAGGASQAGGAAGAISFIGGIGGQAGSTTGVGGVGGAASLTGGLGGAQQAGTTAGGAGGAASLTSGGGGAQAAGSGNGGAGGLTSVIAGAGGNAAGGTGDGGAGGAIAVTTGVGGTSLAGTTAGAGGVMTLTTGAGAVGAAAVVAGAGGAASVTTGVGGAASGTAAGGAGGAMTLTGAAGGAHTGGGATGAGGAGGANSLIAGAGGATSNVGSNNGGIGGAIAVTSGVGGLASAGTGDGGNGGAVGITTGAGGTSLGGTSGIGGAFSASSGTGAAGAAAIVAGAGGASSITTGAGGGASGTVAGGAGGTLTLTASAGGAHTGGGATGAGGAGGAASLIAGAGGATSNIGATNGGNGGDVAITAGIGGLTSAGTADSDGGTGGDITLTAGGSATSSSGEAGAPGKVKVGTGRFEFTNAQTLDMSDAQLALTLIPGAPTGTTITSNVMYVDANSSSIEDLLLPPEADCNGLELIIKNTGGEDIVVKENGDATIIATVPPLNTGIFVCDGTTWSGGVTNIDLGSHAMGTIDFNTTGTGAMTVTINSVAYLEANSEDFPNGVWTNGSSAANSAVSLTSAIQGDTRATVNYTAIADESGDGVILISDIPGVIGNVTLASDDGTATVSAATMAHGANTSHSRMTTYEHTVNATDDLAGNIDIPLPFAPVGFTLQVRSSTGLYEMITALVTIETSPNRIRIDYDGATDPDATDIINVIAWK